MAHVRTQLRNAVKAALLNLSLTQDRVYTGRTRALGEAHDPALLVYTWTETSGRDAAGRPPLLARPVIVHIEGRVSHSEPPDDLLDQIAEQVEAAMVADISFGGASYHTQFVGTQIDVQTSGARHVGGIRLEYRCTYRTREGEPAQAV